MRYLWQRATFRWTKAMWFLSRQLGGRRVLWRWSDETPRKRLVVRWKDQ